MSFAKVKDDLGSHRASILPAHKRFALSFEQSFNLQKRIANKYPKTTTIHWVDVPLSLNVTILQHVLATWSTQVPVLGTCLTPPCSKPKDEISRGWHWQCGMSLLVGLYSACAPRRPFSMNHAQMAHEIKYFLHQRHDSSIECPERVDCEYLSRESNSVLQVIIPVKRDPAEQRLTWFDACRDSMPPLGAVELLCDELYTSYPVALVFDRLFFSARDCVRVLTHLQSSLDYLALQPAARVRDCLQGGAVTVTPLKIQLPTGSFLNTDKLQAAAMRTFENWFDSLFSITVKDDQASNPKVINQALAARATVEEPPKPVRLNVKLAQTLESVGSERSLWRDILALAAAVSTIRTFVGERVGCVWAPLQWPGALASPDCLERNDGTLPLSVDKWPEDDMGLIIAAACGFEQLYRIGQAPENMLMVMDQDTLHWSSPILSGPCVSKVDSVFEPPCQLQSPGPLFIYDSENAFQVYLLTNPFEFFRASAAWTEGWVQALERLSRIVLMQPQLCQVLFPAQQAKAWLAQTHCCHLLKLPKHIDAIGQDSDTQHAAKQGNEPTVVGAFLQQVLCLWVEKPGGISWSKTVFQVALNRLLRSQPLLRSTIIFQTDGQKCFPRLWHVQDESVDSEPFYEIADEQGKVKILLEQWQSQQAQTATVIELGLIDVPKAQLCLVGRYVSGVIDAGVAVRLMQALWEQMCAVSQHHSIAQSPPTVDAHSFIYQLNLHQSKTPVLFNCDQYPVAFDSLSQKGSHPVSVYHHAYKVCHSTLILALDHLATTLNLEFEHLFFYLWMLWLRQLHEARQFSSDVVQWLGSDGPVCHGSVLYGGSFDTRWLRLSELPVQDAQLSLCIQTIVDALIQRQDALPSHKDQAPLGRFQMVRLDASDFEAQQPQPSEVSSALPQPQTATAQCVQDRDFLRLSAIERKLGSGADLECLAVRSGDEVHLSLSYCGSLPGEFLLNDFIAQLAAQVADCVPTRQVQTVACSDLALPIEPPANDQDELSQPVVDAPKPENLSQSESENLPCTLSTCKDSVDRKDTIACEQKIVPQCCPTLWENALNDLCIPSILISDNSEKSIDAKERCFATAQLPDTLWHTLNQVSTHWNQALEWEAGSAIQAQDIVLYAYVRTLQACSNCSDAFLIADVSDLILDIDPLSDHSLNQTEQYGQIETQKHHSSTLSSKRLFTVPVPSPSSIIEPDETLAEHILAIKKRWGLARNNRSSLVNGLTNMTEPDCLFAWGTSDFQVAKKDSECCILSLPSQLGVYYQRLESGAVITVESTLAQVNARLWLERMLMVVRRLCRVHPMFLAHQLVPPLFDFELEKLKRFWRGARRIAKWPELTTMLEQQCALTPDAVALYGQSVDEHKLDQSLTQQASSSPQVVRYAQLFDQVDMVIWRCQQETSATIAQIVAVGLLPEHQVVVLLAALALQVSVLWVDSDVDLENMVPNKHLEPVVVLSEAGADLYCMPSSVRGSVFLSWAEIFLALPGACVQRKRAAFSNLRSLDPVVTFSNDKARFEFCSKQIIDAPVTQLVLRNQIAACARSVQLTASDTVAVMAPLSYAHSLQLLLSCWMFGAKARVSAKTFRHPSQWVSFISTQRITVLQLPISTWVDILVYALQDSSRMQLLKSLRVILLINDLWASNSDSDKPFSLRSQVALESFQQWIHDDAYHCTVLQLWVCGAGGLTLAQSTLKETNLLFEPYLPPWLDNLEARLCASCESGSSSRPVLSGAQGALMFRIGTTQLSRFIPTGDICLTHADGRTQWVQRQDGLFRFKWGLCQPVVICQKISYALSTWLEECLGLSGSVCVNYALIPEQGLLMSASVQGLKSQQHHLPLTASWCLALVEPNAPIPFLDLSFIDYLCTKIEWQFLPDWVSLSFA